MYISQSKLLLVVVLVLGGIVYVYNRNNESMDNAAPVTANAPTPTQVNAPSAQIPNIPVTREDINVDALAKKFDSKNKARAGEYKASNYVDGSRTGEASQFDVFFDSNNELTKDSTTVNNEFAPNDETNGNLSSYVPGKKAKLTDEDIFRAEDYLPKDEKDWFEVMPEPISVKNRYLINVTRPVGVNTVGNSHRNMSYDIRGTPVVPKNVISPFLNSSIEPDLNLKNLC